MAGTARLDDFFLQIHRQSTEKSGHQLMAANTGVAGKNCQVW
jgi:hypothetical protein